MWCCWHENFCAIPISRYTRRRRWAWRRRRPCSTGGRFRSDRNPLVQRNGTGVLQDIESAGEAVVGVNEALLVHNGVIDLCGGGGRVGRWGWRIAADLFQVSRRIRDTRGAGDDAENAHAAIEPTGDGGVFEVRGGGAWKIWMQVVCPEAAAGLAQLAIGGT